MLLPKPFTSETLGWVPGVTVSRSAQVMRDTRSGAKSACSAVSQQLGKATQVMARTSSLKKQIFWKGCKEIRMEVPQKNEEIRDEPRGWGHRPNAIIAFLPRSKRLFTSWLQSPPAVILEPKKIKSATVFIFSPSSCHEVMRLDAISFLNIEV